jgi:hypothetical protein
MSTELLEKPIDITQAGHCKDTGAPASIGASHLEPNAKQVQSVWRRIFEGREEFLGWTPD